MSFGLFRKLLSCLGISALLWLAMPTVGRAQQTCAPCAASFGTPCGAGCQTNHCPPAFRYTVEGPPRIHWHCGCPHPICNPCDLPHWGYYETCWNPYPFPPNWTHCPSPPPAAFVTLNPLVHPNLPTVVTPRNTFGPPQPLPNGPIVLPPGNGLEDLNQPRRYEEKRPGLN
jgi:hypothetical protein